MIVWITKYALTQGILEMDVRQADTEIVVISAGFRDGCFWAAQYFHRGEWFKTKEDAIVKAEDMRQRKLRSLQKQITKLQKMQFI